MQTNTLPSLLEHRVPRYWRSVLMALLIRIREKETFIHGYFYHIGRFHQEEYDIPNSVPSPNFYHYVSVKFKPSNEGQIYENCHIQYISTAQHKTACNSIANALELPQSQSR